MNEDVMKTKPWIEREALEMDREEKKTLKMYVSKTCKQPYGNPRTRRAFKNRHLGHRSDNSVDLWIWSSPVVMSRVV
ncbi:Hypothetical protein CINCED_3A014277 [Cinara cedri]|uniref:Uncharacterized protein n=1 Tax=Cinara cedri TaxID=506608 RepID=A0A5E4MDN4_9HEMI|nr:Hypothetical protein CINCED_3A014277 [Cinara cedri]